MSGPVEGPGESTPGAPSGAADARPPRPPWSRFRRALEDAGFHPSKRLGQNFLLDENMARAIAEEAGVQPGERVLEVGPGCGFLSVHLAHAGAELLCVEVDPRLAPIAADFLAPYPSARVVLADALGGKNTLGPEVVAWLDAGGERPWRLVSNLPYSISGPVLALAAARDVPPVSFTVLVQREVGERLAAAPGTAEWGPLGLAVQLSHAVELGRPVPPGLFWPRPKVDSAVVHGRVRADRAPGPVRRAAIGLARELFTRRRQVLRRVLGEALGDRAEAEARLARLGLDPGRRAETLTPAEWLALSGAGPLPEAPEAPEVPDSQAGPEN